MSASMQCNLEHVTSRENTDGTFRYYFRKRGHPLTRLHGELFSEPFMRAYRKCLEEPKSDEVAAGTFEWICDQYMLSPAFTSKAKATQDARRRVIKTMVNEPIDPDRPTETFGGETAKAMSQDYLEVLRDRKAGNPNAGNERIKILAQIFKHAKSKKYVPVNIAIGIEKLSTPKGGHDTATDEHLEKYFAKHTSGPAWVAGMLLKHIGMRVSDLRILGLPNIVKGKLVFKTVKTGVLCQLPIVPELDAALPRGNMTFLLSEAGKPFESDKALSQRVSKWFSQAGVEGITAHSVRKWRATKMAEQGATEYQLMASFGWSDPKEARPYVQAANRQKMAQEASDKMIGL